MDSQQIQLFTAGLREELAIDVELHQPDDLQEAMGLARAYERKASRLASGTRPALRAPFRSGPAAANLPTAPAATTEGSQEQAPRQFRRLSPAELAERRCQGLCYNCDEKFVRGHKCARLFYIEYDDNVEGDMEPAPDEPRVSLNVLAGLDGANTMRLPVEIAGERVVALVDSGSTHNFIHTELARHLCLHLSPVRHDLYVVVANGDRLVSPGRCANLRLRIEGKLFTVDCFALDISTVDIILGTEWLSTLGPILWDFRNMRMSIWRSTREVTLHGLANRRPPHCEMLETEDLLPRLLDDFADIFAEPQGLPPARPIDHRIHLKPDASPVAVRPYRYPQLQKDELEK